MTDSSGAAALPAYERLAAKIRAHIMDGQLSPGDRLPSETRLAQSEDVSRSTVREALRTLQEAGYVERASPRIMVVRPHDDEPTRRELTRALRRHNLTFDRLHEALLVLDPELSRLAAQRAVPSDLDELAQNLSAQERALRDFDEWNRLDQEFHLIVAEIADNAALILARVPVTEILMPAMHQFVTSATATSAALRWHHRILDQIARHDGEAAALMTRRHVDDFRAAWIAAGFDTQRTID
jgi:GntR family transcriptional repressor for pyruvate dehydrogenase complex